MEFRKKTFLTAAACCLAFVAQAQRNQNLRGREELKRLYFDLYADSIKPVLNYYVNVVGQLKNGRYIPLDTTHIYLYCDNGRMAGNEWVLPGSIDFEKVTFTAISRYDPQLRDSVTVYLKKSRDPRDAPDYEEGQRLRNNGR